jgi:uncharacterized protein (UPF0335 family)
MPYELAMSDDLSRIQLHQRAQEAVERMQSDVVRIEQLEGQIARLATAAKQVLSDVDDDGVAERDDMSVLALRKAVDLSPANELQDVIACARRVSSKFGSDSDWSEWRDLRDALADLDNWPIQP